MPRTTNTGSPKKTSTNKSINLVDPELSKRIRWLTFGYTNAELGHILDVNYESVRRWRLGMIPPPAHFLAALCDSFGASANWLLMGRGPWKSRGR